MLDVSISYNRYKFLGYEYLTWLWYLIENGQDQIKKLEQEPASLQIGNRMVLENRKEDAVQSLTIKGDDADLEEGILALRKGAVVSELNLWYKLGDQQWRFTVKAESLHITSLKCPATGSVESQEDLEGAVLEKVYLCEKVLQLTDNLFKQFIKLRVSEDWNKKVIPRIKKWISA
jgi:hypothetical protein